MPTPFGWMRVKDTHPLAPLPSHPQHHTYVAPVQGGYLVEVWLVEGTGKNKKYWGGGLTFVPMPHGGELPFEWDDSEPDEAPPHR